ncbi:MAG: class I SAM-dependent methyltransferase, partial [Veillonella sp.]|nr:class I SAM-dependent methyltransferase [Veillonella sp.]
MLDAITSKMEEKAMVKFLQRFDAHPFKLIFKGNEYIIGQGEPTFTVEFKKAIPMTKLMDSTSIALGEAYMDGDLVIEGNLYHALLMFMGQMEKFSTSGTVWNKLVSNPLTRKNQQEEIQQHYDIGNDFYKLWLDETMSYSCGYFATDRDTLYHA